MGDLNQSDESFSPVRNIKKERLKPFLGNLPGADDKKLKEIIMDTYEDIDELNKLIGECDVKDPNDLVTGIEIINNNFKMI